MWFHGTCAFCVLFCFARFQRVGVKVKSNIFKIHSTWINCANLKKFFSPRFYLFIPLPSLMKRNQMLILWHFHCHCKIMVMQKILSFFYLASWTWSEHSFSYIHISIKNKLRFRKKLSTWDKLERFKIVKRDCKYAFVI